ncbi:hypothetical protein Tco_0588926 [Tanacetum coccineum]
MGAPRPKYCMSTASTNSVRKLRAMVPTTTPLSGFREEVIWPLGQLRLLVMIGDAKHLQWNSWQAEHKGDPSYFFYGPSDAKVPGEGRCNYDP